MATAEQIKHLAAIKESSKKLRELTLADEDMPEAEKRAILEELDIMDKNCDLYTSVFDDNDKPRD